MRYWFEWTPGIILLGAVVVLPLAPGFAMIGVVVVAFVALAALVALAGAILATPYLVVRSVRRRLAQRHESTEASVPIATAIALADPS